MPKVSIDLGAHAPPLGRPPASTPHRRFHMPANLQPQFIAFLIRLSVFLLVELAIYLLL